MDERAIKRLLIIVVASIIAIVVIKVALTKTYTNLNKAAAVKKQTAPANPSAPPQPPAPAASTDAPAASSVDDAPTKEIPAASGASETR